MIRLGWLTAWRDRTIPWPASALTAAWVGLVAVEPAPLLPLADAYRAFCEEHPILALLTNHASPVVMALLVSLVAVAALNGGRDATATLIGTMRFHRRLRREDCAAPERLIRLGRDLGLDGRLTFLPRTQLAAFCYGFVRPKVAVSAGLLASLDDEQLRAVLAHEREHQRRHDPARSLALRALCATVFMFPLGTALRRRLETHLELNADRSAIALVGREALAGALLATLVAPQPAVVGAVGLSATEARIAHLTGVPALPPIPKATVAASSGLILLIAVAATRLADSADMIGTVCEFCASLTCLT